jgi:hypothetical protein
MIFYLVKQVLACVLVFVKIQHALLHVVLSHLARQQCRLQAEASGRDIN